MNQGPGGGICFNHAVCRDVGVVSNCYNTFQNSTFSKISDPLQSLSTWDSLLRWGVLPHPQRNRLLEPGTPLAPSGRIPWSLKVGLWCMLLPGTASGLGYSLKGQLTFGVDNTDPAFWNRRELTGFPLSSTLPWPLLPNMPNPHHLDRDHQSSRGLCKF